MNIINDWHTKQLCCHFCGETRSVKYEMRVADPTLDGKLRIVTVCNRCALTHKEVDE